jgi:membrane carboxypeptidase/penicillin-binding protein
MARIASGITGAAPIWNEIETKLLLNEKSSQWEIPNGLTQAPICELTGTLSCSGCPIVNEWFLDGTQPKNKCDSNAIGQLKLVNDQNHENKENGRTQ